MREERTEKKTTQKKNDLIFMVTFIILSRVTLTLTLLNFVIITKDIINANLTFDLDLALLTNNTAQGHLDLELANLHYFIKGHHH